MKTIISHFALLFAFTAMAQNNATPCGFDEYTNNKSILKTEAIIQSGVEKLKNSPESSHDSIRTIPVVIHVIHTGGAENISDAQIFSQIQIMNEDYGKLPGTNGDGNGVDTKVRFKLAQIDPNGNCTNGIVRIYSTLTNHKTYQRAMLKQLSFWDNTQYMNIYLVKTISGNVLGYSSFPGGPADEDGMVVRSDVFGDMGTSNSLGRTASHEIGHWFGLYHTFNNGCGSNVCTDGDYVCDTPPQKSPSFNCTTKNTCSNDNPDLNDLKENYMNYTPDACKDMFTNGQKLRIHATLDSIRTTIWSHSNLVATGTDSTYIAPSVCGVSANFVTLTPTVCQGNTVQFTDISLNNAITWQWSFLGGNPATSNLQNPTVTYNTVGKYNVKLVVTDSATTDSITLINYIDVTTPGVGQPLPFYEDFESGTFPAQGISINNQDGGITWELDSAAAVSGMYSVRINNLINTNYGSADDIILPYLDFSSFSGTQLFMTFDYAYARSDPSFSDELIVLLSTDCGVTFKQVHYRTGNSLTTGPTQTTPFIPDSTQWRNSKVILNAYKSAQYVQIKIVNVTDGGNNLYLDNLNIGNAQIGIEEEFSKSNFRLFPNPANENILVEFSGKENNKTIKIINALGQEVFSENLINKNTLNISTSRLPTGVYFLTSITKNKSFSQQFIIVHP